MGILKFCFCVLTQGKTKFTRINPEVKHSDYMTFSNAEREADPFGGSRKLLLNQVDDKSRRPERHK